MKLDRALQNFTEKYSRESMEYIDRISKEFGLVYNKRSIPSFNINTVFEKFTEYLDGYATYKIHELNEKGEHQELSQTEISDTTKKWCESLFNSKEVTENSDLRYENIPAFIESYINGVKSLLTNIDANKSQLMNEGVELETVGAINDYADMFMEALDPHFEAVMDKILTASGYTTAQKLSGKIPAQKEENYFL